MTRSPVNRGEVLGLADLGRMLLEFGLVQRQTRHADGLTSESDTTHTVMLAVLAGTVRERWYPELDAARVLWAALAHDLVEVVVGDTMTWGITPAGREAKARREAQAVKVLTARFAETAPRLVQAIVDYENLTHPEDRYVKTFDKVLPKITHLANDAAVLRNFSTRQEADALWAQQRAEMAATYAAEFPLLLDLHSALADEVRHSLADETSPASKTLPLDEWYVLTPSPEAQGALQRLALAGRKPNSPEAEKARATLLLAAKDALETACSAAETEAAHAWRERIEAASVEDLESGSFLIPKTDPLAKVRAARAALDAAARAALESGLDSTEVARAAGADVRSLMKEQAR